MHTCISSMRYYTMLFSLDGPLPWSSNEPSYGDTHLTGVDGSISERSVRLVPWQSEGGGCWLQEQKMRESGVGTSGLLRGLLDPMSCRLLVNV